MTHSDIAVLARMWASAGPLFTLTKWAFGIFYSGPYCPCFTADLHCYYSTLRAQLSVYTVLGSVFFFFKVCWHLGSVSSHYGWAFTFRWVHTLTRATRALRAPAICWDGRAAFCGEKRLWANEWRDALPCWLLCTGRRTSVCLRGLHTLLVLSSVCSHVKPELKGTHYVNKTNRASSVSSAISVTQVLSSGCLVTWHHPI